MRSYRSKSSKLLELLRTEITGGALGSGAPLPPELQLADCYGVSRSTIRRVLERLIAEGVLAKEPNRQAWVPGNSPQDAGDLSRKLVGFFREYKLDALTSGIVDGILEHARESGIDLRLFSAISGRSGSILQVYDHVRHYGLDGVLVQIDEYDSCQADLAQLIADGIPLVCIDRVPDGVEANLVEVDNHHGMYAAVSFLLNRYHEPVFFFGQYSTLNTSTSKIRYRSYCEAMEDAGFGAHLAECTIPVQLPAELPEDYASLDRRFRESYACILPWLQQAEFPVNIVCVNDYVAFGVYKAAEKLELKIGREIRLIGFDDLPLASYQNPPLTTVRQPSRQIGKEAVRMLQLLMAKKIKSPTRVTLPVELVKRKST